MEEQIVSFLTDVHSDPAQPVLLTALTDLFHQISDGQLVALFTALPLLRHSQSSIFHAVTRGLILRFKTLRFLHTFAFRSKVTQVIHICLVNDNLAVHAALLAALVAESIFIERTQVKRRFVQDLASLKREYPVPSNCLDVAKIVTAIQDLVLDVDLNDPTQNEAIVQWMLPTLTFSLSSSNSLPELPLMALFISRLLPPILHLLPTLLSSSGLIILPDPLHQTVVLNLFESLPGAFSFAKCDYLSLASSILQALIPLATLPPTVQWNKFIDSLTTTFLHLADIKRLDLTALLKALEHQRHDTIDVEPLFCRIFEALIPSRTINAVYIRYVMYNHILPNLKPPTTSSAQNAHEALLAFFSSTVQEPSSTRLCLVDELACHYVHLLLSMRVEEETRTHALYRTIYSVSALDGRLASRCLEMIIESGNPETLVQLLPAVPASLFLRLLDNVDRNHAKLGEVLSTEMDGQKKGMAVRWWLEKERARL